MGQIIDPNSLLIKSDQQPATVAFFNNLISQFCFAINGVGVRMDGYDAAEQNLVNLGLANINSTLGPFLSTLQQAAQLGFLVAQADGRSVSLTVGQPFEVIFTSNGASLFTPTTWLMAMDVNDYANWGILQTVSWIPQNLNLSTICIYASKTQASASWQVCCGSGVLNAMVNDLNLAQTAATTATNASNSAQTNANYVQSVASALQVSAGVISINGKSGLIGLLAESDIANLTSDLANRPTTTSLNNAVAGLQPRSTNLDQLAAATLTAFGFALFSAANAAAALTTLGAASLTSPAFSGAPTAPTATAGASTTQLATTAFVTGALSALNYVTASQLTTSLASYQQTSANWPSAQITASFNDQTGTTYTMLSSDYGKALTFTNASPITVTLPNSLPKGWNVVIYQGGAGQVTFSPGTGASMAQRLTKNKTAGQYAVASLLVVSNSNGSNAQYVLGGDVA